MGSFLCSDLKEELGERFSALCPTLGLPSGQRQLMIGEPVASRENSNDTKNCCWRSSASCRLSRAMLRPGYQPRVVWREI